MFGGKFASCLVMPVYAGLFHTFKHGVMFPKGFNIALTILILLVLMLGM